MALFKENNQWVDLPLEAIYLLFTQKFDHLGTAGRVEPITLEDGTVITKEIAEVKLLELAIQQWLDSNAQVKGYDTIHSAVLRAAFDGPYKVEGIKYAVWMDTVWLYFYQLLDDVKAGTKTLPNKADLLAQLPSLSI